MKTSATARTSSRTCSPTGGSDSASWVVPRQPLAAAAAVLRTRDRHTALLLTDTTLVLQLTNGGRYHVSNAVSGEPAQSTVGRVFSRMLGAGLFELLEHGIAIRLSALREARAEGTRLVLEDRQGNRVFDSVEFNDRNVMDDFSPAEAERFAAEVNRAIRKRP